MNKPLPQSPTRSRTSSVYSGGSGYTRIIESYDRSDGEAAPVPAILAPTAYRDTGAALTNHRDEIPWYANVPKTEDISLRASQSIPTLQYTPFRDDIWNASVHEVSQAPAFSEFQNQMHDHVSPISSGSWQHRNSQAFLSPPLVSPPLFDPDYCLLYDHEPNYLPSPMSGSVTEMSDPQLAPHGLCMGTTASMCLDGPNPYSTPSRSSVKYVELLDIKEAQRRSTVAKQADLEARAAELVERRSHQRQSHLVDIKEAQQRAAVNSLRSSETYEQQAEPTPRSVSSNNFVVNTGLRESFKTMIKQKIKQKKEEREIEKAVKAQDRERKRVICIAEEKYPAIQHSPRASQDDERNYSWTGSSGQRNSFTDGVTNIFRNLSISKTQRAEEENRGRGMERGRRPKQLAVPPSPYQNYGAEVLFAKNKKMNAEGGIQLGPTKKATARFVSNNDIKALKKKSGHFKEAYHLGRKELVSVLHMGGGEKQRREKAYKLVRTLSEVRREKLKQSIAVIVPVAQLVATQMDDL